MADHSIETLLVRITDLEGRLEATTVAPARPSSRRRRTVLVAGLLALALLVPVGVFASHSFTDVPDSNTFHTQIGRVAGAGITAGCTPTTYCPNAEVSRGQMAAFLARSAGRVAVDDFVSVPLSTTDTTLATVSIKAGDVTGGYANILVEGTASAVNGSLASCPCGTVFFLADPVNQIGWPAYSLQVAGNGFGSGVGSIALNAVVTVPTGVAHTFVLRGFETLGTAAATTVWGTLTATYIPFAGDGTNALVPVSAEIDVDPVAQPRD